jgi:thioredoxin reductase (NADPH)
VDVDADPVLERRFGEHVPVLMDGEHELCRHRLEPASVSAYLAKLP